MRLTNYHRDAFVAAVLNDTPATEAKSLEELYKKVAIEEALKATPAEVRKMWESNTLRPYVRTCSYWSGFGKIGSFYVPSSSDHNVTFTHEAKTRLNEIKSKIDAAYELRAELESKLRAVAMACTTRKALVAALPEFEKYLPEEQKVGSNLPALANVVSDFVKAGWPAQKQAQAA
jgi:hypothetical protein